MKELNVEASNRDLFESARADDPDFGAYLWPLAATGCRRGGPRRKGGVVATEQWSDWNKRTFMSLPSGAASPATNEKRCTQWSASDRRPRTST